MTVAGLLRFALAAVLVATAAAKLVAGGSARSALRSYGVDQPLAQALLWAAAIAVESSLGFAVALDVGWAAVAAGALMALFAAALVWAIARGRTGSPCGCLGARSRIGWSAVTRAALLSVAFAALPFVPDARPSADAWLAVGLTVALAGVLGLGIAILALARELGELRLAVAPQAALSIEQEGPPLGSRVALIDRFERAAPLALAVFTSAGCALCAALEPSLRLVSSDPEVELELFDEEADAGAWAELEIPGSPYGVVLSPDGKVLAKGTFNSLYQLESLLVAATRPVNA